MLVEEGTHASRPGERTRPLHTPHDPRRQGGVLPFLVPRLPLVLSNMASASTNPFILQQMELRSHFYVAPGAYFDINLTVLAGLYAFSLACVVVAAIMRTTKGTFWIVRITRTSTGGFVAPNQLCCWLFFVGVYAICGSPAQARRTSLTRSQWESRISSPQNVMLGRARICKG